MGPKKLIRHLYVDFVRRRTAVYARLTDLWHAYISSWEIEAGWCIAILQTWVCKYWGVITVPLCLGLLNPPSNLAIPTRQGRLSSVIFLPGFQELFHMLILGNFVVLQIHTLSPYSYADYPERNQLLSTFRNTHYRPHALHLDPLGFISNSEVVELKISRRTLKCATVYLSRYPAPVDLPNLSIAGQLRRQP